LAFHYLGLLDLVVVIVISIIALIFVYAEVNSRCIKVHTQPKFSASDFEILSKCLNHEIAHFDMLH